MPSYRFDEDTPFAPTNLSLRPPRPNPSGSRNLSDSLYFDDEPESLQYKHYGPNTTMEVGEPARKPSPSSYSYYGPSQSNIVNQESGVQRDQNSSEDDKKPSATTQQRQGNSSESSASKDPKTTTIQNTTTNPASDENLREPNLDPSAYFHRQPDNSPFDPYRPSKWAVKDTRSIPVYVKDKDGNWVLESDVIRNVPNPYILQRGVENANVNTSSNSSSSSPSSSELKSSQDLIVPDDYKIKLKVPREHLPVNFYNQPSNQNIENDVLLSFNKLVSKETLNMLLQQMELQYLKGSAKERKFFDVKKLSFSDIQPIHGSGCVVVMFPFSHKYTRNDFMFHKCMSVKVHVPQNFAILFVSDLLHSGASSRKYVNMVLKDPRVFMYIQRVNKIKEKRSRSDATLLPEGNRTPQPLMMCNCLTRSSNVVSSCEYCEQMNPDGEKVIDLHELFSKEELDSKNVGDVLFGDLEELGFIVYRAFIPNDDIQNHVDGIMSSEYRTGGKAKGKDQKNRRFLFTGVKNEMLLNSKWKNDKLTNFIVKKYHKLTSTVLKQEGTEYELIKPNLIWNSGEIKIDQIPHYDFPEEKEE